MAKKNKKKSNKKEEEIVEQTDVESVEENAPEPEADLAKSDAVPSELGVEAETDIPLDETDEPESENKSDDDEFSADDLLDDVRQSLIDENIEVEKEKKPKWWQKIGIGAKAKKDEVPEEETSPVADLESLIVADVESEAEQTEDTDDSIDDLIEILEADDAETSEKEEISVDIDPVDQDEPVVEVKKVDVNELKRRAFEGSKAGDKEESFSDVRAVALEDGEEVFVEVESKPEDASEDRLKAFENALRPYRRYINFVIAFIGIVVIIITSALLYDTLKPPPTPTPPPSNLPYPVVLNIADSNITFNLGRGSLNDGRWDPRRPEWLEGTEVCRWVAIPHNRQMEAVVRTLTQDDQLELVMSNNDRWSYDVYSITQMTIEDMQKVSSNSPCLLLVLADVNTDTRWVVTAYP